MTVEEKNFEITQILISGKKILDCYKQHGYPTSGSAYKAFTYDALTIVMEYEKYHNLSFYLSFLINNENNTLPYPSSGSLRAALEDFDDFLGAVDSDGEDFTDENYIYMETLYKSLFR